MSIKVILGAALSLTFSVGAGCSSGTAGPGTTGSGSATTGSGHPLPDGGCPFCLPGPYAGVCETQCPAGATVVGHSSGSAMDCGFTNSSCPLGLADCGGENYPCLFSDPSNCGACGHVCPAGAQCAFGACTQSCAGGVVEIESDPQNCGACGNVCDAGEICGAGVCGGRCAPTPSSCTGDLQTKLPDGGVSCLTCPGCHGGNTPLPTCVDLTADSNNCGSCGSPCPAGRICSSGLCIPPCSSGQVCGAGSCQSTCPAGLTACAATAGATPSCADLRNDPQHCGSCDTSCPSCVAGTCVGSCSYYGPDAG